MALITANGVNLPTPTDFQVGITDISKTDRNAAGTTIREVIATKRTLSLSWAYLSSTDMSTVLNAVSGVSYSVTYYDPQTNGNRTGNFYTGDRSLGMMDFISGVPRYKDVKFDLIEM
jgi:hypothetical protein